MSLKTILASFAALALLAAAVPAFALAQVYPYSNDNCYAPYYQYTVNNNCTPGYLAVDVQVINGYNNQYNYPYNNSSATPAPSAFSVSVSGQNPNPSTFAGSVSGTLVQVEGYYSVSAAQLPGYAASYSTGCTGTIYNGANALCVITENNAYPYSSYPTPYPYGYALPTLTCSPQYQTVDLGQPVTFSAQGGSDPVFNWQTPVQSYQGVGPTLNTLFTQTGTQTVTVQNGTQTASCTVNVVASGAPATVYPEVPIITPSGYVTPSGYGAPSVTPTYYPRLPDTGFTPQNGAAFAFAAVTLIALLLLAVPYVRKAFAIVLG